MNLNKHLENVIRLKANKEQTKKDVKKIKEKIKQDKIEFEASMKAQAILQSVAKDTQSEVTYHISNIITLALNSIFEENYEFKLDFIEKRNKTEADIYLLKDGERMNPMSDNGGGVVDVISFALRIAFWNIVKNRNTIILDEPMKFLSRELQEKAGTMLKELSQKLGIQFIIVSHDKALIESADKIFNVSLKKGVSYVS